MTSYIGEDPQYAVVMALNRPEQREQEERAEVHESLEEATMSTAAEVEDKPWLVTYSQTTTSNPPSTRKNISGGSI